MKIVLAVALVASVAFAACGDDDTNGDATKPAGGGATQVTGGVRPSSSATAGQASSTQPSAAATQAATNGQASDGNAPGIPELNGEIVTTASGLKYIDEKVGDGAAPVQGQTATVHYTGWLTNGKKFDSSVDRGTPFTFNIGQGRVIKGWDEGVATMKVGGKRRLIIPASLGYGASGSPPVIPANATLIFDVELLSVK